MPNDDFRPASFEEEESADLRRHYWRYGIRLAVAFVALYAAVFCAFWWSGSAVRFGASRVADRGVPTWHVVGTVRSANTHEAVPWAKIDDDSSGQPPFFHGEADQAGKFDLFTLAEPHRIRISAPGYQPSLVPIGRVWFLWLPRGEERRDVELASE